jgi:hypothetical protein
VWKRDVRAAGRRRALFAAQLLVVGLVVANCAWILVDELKRALLGDAPPPVLPWAEQFHHPDQAAILPYVTSALAAFGWGLYLYARLRPPAWRPLWRLRRTALAREPALLVAVAGFQGVLASQILPGWLRAALALLSVLVCGAPRGVGRVLRRGVTAFCLVGTAALLVAISVEPVRLATRPVRLLNEYMFLSEGALPDLIRPAHAVVGRAATERCSFAFTNPLEYSLQSMSRGQLNHIGHVLNPLNEYETGKPLESTYFQYGLGATFAFKGVMDLFGGLSLQAYYRTLLLYVLYSLVYLGAVVVLFRDVRYLLVAAGLLAAAHYSLGYQALLLAPGINPVLHFLDVPVLLACLSFFRTGRPAPLALAGLLAVAAVGTNLFFGAMVLAAFLVATGVHALETAPRGRLGARLLALAALVAVPLAALALLLPRTGGGDVTEQFLRGFLSWRPSSVLVFLTLGYLAASYLFLLSVRARRDPAKYAAVYLFVYAQGFLVYFYWSGLESHFWPALPYVGLHVLLMVATLARARPGVAARWEPAVLVAALLGVALLVKTGSDGFVRERNHISRLFRRWETHRWPFARARVVSTADPAPLAASLAQIERWVGPADRGVAILSVFDGLVPFLAGRHSIFPHFDLQWGLLTDADRERAAEILARARPPVVFVGREVEGDVVDPWERCGNGMDPERESAKGRVRELRRVFDAVSADYERVDAGPLLSVYRRRDAAP